MSKQTQFWLVALLFVFAAVLTIFMGGRWWAVLLFSLSSIVWIFRAIDTSEEP